MHVGGTMPPPTPIRRLKPNAAANVGASAMPSDPAASRQSPTSSTGLRPYASETGPATRAVAPQTAAAAVTSWPARGTVTPNAPAMSTSSGPSIATAVTTRNTASAMLPISSG
jgi:hypothetical protein